MWCREQPFYFYGRLWSKNKSCIFFQLHIWDKLFFFVLASPVVLFFLFSYTHCFSIVNYYFLCMFFFHLFFVIQKSNGCSLNVKFTQRDIYNCKKKKKEVYNAFSMEIHNCLCAINSRKNIYMIVYCVEFLHFLPNLFFFPFN